MLDIPSITICGIEISSIIIPGIIGAFFSALDKPFQANFVWIGSNLIMAWRSHGIGDDTNTMSYIFFGGFALFGVIRHLWQSKPHKEVGINGGEHL